MRSKRKAVKTLRNELPKGYIEREGTIYKVLENGSEVAIKWTKKKASEVLRGND